MSFDLNLCDLLFLAAIGTGLVFALLLLFVRRANQAANRYLGLALLVIVLWIAWVGCIDIRLDRYYARWNWLPLQFSLSLGPLVYFYVRQMVEPGHHFKRNDLWHFAPILLEQAVWFAEILESRNNGIATYDTRWFLVGNPLLQLLALISVVTYIRLSLRLLKAYHKQLNQQLSDADHYQFRWLRRLLAGFACLWLLWLPFVGIDYFFYQYRLGISSYYPLYLLMSAMSIWIGVEAFLRPEFILADLPQVLSILQTNGPDEELQQQTARLRKEMEKNLFYRNAGLTLRELAEAIGLHPNELSRIINAGAGQNFNDFVNAYRVEDVIRKLEDPAYDHITLLGIAFDSGFNSKTTFNRTFKDVTGKSPAAYKSELKTATIL